MKAQLDCVACFQEQALRAARAAGVSENMQEQVLRTVMQEVAEADWDGTPLQLGMMVHRRVREITGVDDPFAKAKGQATEAALTHVPELRERIAQAEDPLRMAVRIAIAGNIIDLGALSSFDLEETLTSVATVDFAIDHYEALRSRVESAQTVLVFADNAGEIVFDRLLLETIADRWSPEITLVVKSGPFINDATLNEAQASGLEEIEGLIMREVSNGDDVGAPVYASEQVNRWICGHDLTIAKGQANYEALSDQQDVFFLLMAKCPCVAEAIGVSVGDVVLRHGRRQPTPTSAAATAPSP
ncbi:MAG: DUF89 family protein [Armatimonadia bacterium]|nr:DUF89 family protein [Armatimonadia bacterium]